MSSTSSVPRPGRVNLMGDHTDYSGRSRPSRRDRPLRDARRHTAKRRRYRPSLAGVRGRDEALLRTVGSTQAARRGVATPLPCTTSSPSWGVPEVGIEGSVRSDIPVGAGVSSSAAFEVALATAFCGVAGLAPDPKDLALACQRAEHRAVGVPCGPMDQLASALGIAGHALRIDCGTLDVQPVRLPAGVRILVLDSAVPRRLEHTAYAERRAEVERGHPGRMRHVESENERVDALCGLLEAPILDRASIGNVFAASHRSLAEDFEVSTAELDLSRGIGAQRGRIRGAPDRSGIRRLGRRARRRRPGGCRRYARCRTLPGRERAPGHSASL